MRLTSRMALEKSSARAGSTRYSTVIRTGPRSASCIPTPKGARPRHQQAGQGLAPREGQRPRGGAERQARRLGQPAEGEGLPQPGEKERARDGADTETAEHQAVGGRAAAELEAQQRGEKREQ